MADKMRAIPIKDAEAARKYLERALLLLKLHEWHGVRLMCKQVQRRLARKEKDMTNGR